MRVTPDPLRAAPPARRPALRPDGEEVWIQTFGSPGSDSGGGIDVARIKADYPGFRARNYERPAGFGAELPITEDLAVDATPEERELLATAVEEFFAEHTEVSIDRVPVRHDRGPRDDQRP